ncbi:hypothetical protein M5D96_014262 [Drosophila gunungcola]|uniref:Uncharacterized protein n=1 Tax=Drosophila gunungcola TaxID=103775 RepID=A0A9P9Y9Q3_9MUSC|nr:hypothetical protein M5D96_014262 [Drosophila gunungcola]
MSSQRELDRSQNANLAVTPVGICQGARKHLRVSSLAAVKSEGIGQESKRYFGISSLAAVTPVGICQGVRKHLRQSQPSS